MHIKRLAKELPETVNSTFQGKVYGDLLPRIHALQTEIHALDRETRAWAINDLVTMTTALLAIYKAEGGK